jgi:hypothetical protein
MPARDKVDVELDQLISRVSAVQKGLGGAGKEGVERTLDLNGNVDQFEDLKHRLSERFTEIIEYQDIIADLKNGQMGEGQTERIRKEQQYRSTMSQLENELKELEVMQKSESKKKRSKYTKGDLEIRGSEISQFKHKLEDLKEYARRGFVGNREGYSRNNLVDIKDSELFNGNNININTNTNTNTNTGPKEAITSEQQQQMEQIQQKDNEIDNALTGLGKGVDMLKELALRANTEVKSQTVLLDGLEEQLEDVSVPVSVHAHMPVLVSMFVFMFMLGVFSILFFSVLFTLLGCLLSS